MSEQEFQANAILAILCLYKTWAKSVNIFFIFWSSFDIDTAVNNQNPLVWMANIVRLHNISGKYVFAIAVVLQPLPENIIYLLFRWIKVFWVLLGLQFIVFSLVALDSFKSLNLVLNQSYLLFRQIKVFQVLSGLYFIVCSLA